MCHARDGLTNALLITCCIMNKRSLIVWPSLRILQPGQEGSKGQNKKNKKKRTWAPSSTRVSMSTPVWMVMCRLPAMRAPLSGFLSPYLCLIIIRPGISFSAISSSLRPKSASDMSAEGHACAHACTHTERWSDAFTYLGERKSRQKHLINQNTITGTHRYWSQYTTTNTPTEKRVPLIKCFKY